MVTVATPQLWSWHSQSSSVLAETITLSIDNGSYLVSALTVVVTLASLSIWNLVAAGIHIYLTRRDPVDAIDLQRQVILHNPSTPLGTSWKSFQLLRAWSSSKGGEGKGKAPARVKRRTFPLVVTSLVIYAGLFAASIFASRVTNKGYDSVVAQAKPDNCGSWSYDTSTVAGQAAANSKVLNDTLQARTYVTAFYQNTSTGGSPSARSVFVQPRLGFTTSASAACPFPDEGVCLLGHDGAYQMVSDHLDSHAMLGINAPARDRVSIQKSVTCSPIGLRKFSVNVNNTFIEIDVGPISNVSDYTYRYPVETASDGIGYLLIPVYSVAEAASPGWVPVDAFVRNDGDVSIYLLSQNSLGYMQATFDPFFSANGTYLSTVQVAGRNLSLPDHFVNGMGCVDQYVLCNAATSSCTAPGGIQSMRKAWNGNSLGLNAAQLATASRIILALPYLSTYSSVAGLGAGALFANNLVYGIISPGQPDTQWQTEALGWFQTSLVKLQSYVVEFVSNAGDLGPFGQVISPLNRAAKANDSADAATWKALGDQCTTQLIVAGAGEAQNFSFLGVLIIACVGLLVFILDQAKGCIVDCVGRKGKWLDPLRSARQADDQLHLLRLALGDRDGGRWENGAGDVPVLSQAAAVSRPEMQGGLVQYPSELHVVNSTG